MPSIHKSNDEQYKNISENASIRKRLVRARRTGWKRQDWYISLCQSLSPVFLDLDPETVKRQILWKIIKLVTCRHGTDGEYLIGRRVSRAGYLAFVCSLMRSQLGVKSAYFHTRC